MEAFSYTLLIGLCTMFVISAVPKMASLTTFRDLVVDYEVLPKSVSSVYGLLLPFVELAAALLLLHPASYRLGAVILLLLLVSFAVAVRSVIKRGKVLTCGCYGKFLDAEADRFTLLKISMLAAALLVLLVIPSEWIAPSAGSAVIGMFGTLLLLASQKVWTLYRSSIHTLKTQGSVTQ